MTPIDYSLLLAAVLLGGGLAFLLERRQTEQLLRLVLSFSGAYLLGITILHLLPGLFPTSSIETGLWMVAGFVAHVLLDIISEGIEHGHIHGHSHLKPSFAIPIMIGLCIHALMEGLPLGHMESFYQNSHFQTHHHNHLLWGIILHKGPAAFALITMLRMANISKLVSIGCLVLFGLMSPLGAYLSEVIVRDSYWQQAIIAFVAGSFLHISTTILFEADNAGHHRVSWRKLVAIFLGLFIAWLSL